MATDPTQELLSPTDFAIKIKEKYPQYKDVDDLELVNKILEKYPTYESQVDMSLKKKDESELPTQQQALDSTLESGSLDIQPTNLPQIQNELGEDLPQVSDSIPADPNGILDKLPIDDVIKLKERATKSLNEFYKEAGVKEYSLDDNEITKEALKIREADVEQRKYEDMDFISDTWKKIKANTKTALGGLAQIPSYLNKQMFQIFADEKDLEFMNSLDPKMREQLINTIHTTPIPSFTQGTFAQAGADLHDEFIEDAEKLYEQTTQFDKSIGEDILNGDLAKAGRRIASEGIGSIPSLVQAMIPYVGIGSIIASSTANKQEELEDEGYGLGWRTSLNSALSGTAEGVADIFTKKIGTKLWKTMRGSTDPTTVLQGFKDWVIASGGEGASEALTGVVQEMSDAFISGKEVKFNDAVKRITDQFLVGGGVGGGIGGGTFVSQRVGSIRDGARIDNVVNSDTNDYNSIKDAFAPTTDFEVSPDKAQLSAITTAPAKIEKDLKKAVAKGEMTEGEARAYQVEFDKTRDAYKKTQGTTMTPKDRVKSMSLIKEKESLKREVEAMDEALAVPKKERIKEIDTELTSIATGKPQEVIEDTTEAPPKKEAEPKPEVKKTTPKKEKKLPKKEVPLPKETPKTTKKIKEDVETTEVSEQSPREELQGSDEANKRMEGLSNRLRESRVPDEKKPTKHELEDNEKSTALKHAKEKGEFVEDFFTFGEDRGIGGNENVVVVNPDEGVVYKKNNLMNSRQSIQRLLDKVKHHNEVFPETKYDYVGITGEQVGNRPPTAEVVLKQDLIEDAEQATPEEIKNYMESRGFKQTTPESYVNDKFLVSDLYPRNVLIDKNGIIYPIDAEVRLVKEVEAENKERDQKATLKKPLKDDEEIQAQGVSFKKTPRDLTGKGTVLDLRKEARKAKRWFNRTFRSNQGLDAKNGEAIRSKNRILASYTDALNFETQQFKKLLNDVKKKDGKNFKENSLKINDYLAGENVDASFLTKDQINQLDYFRNKIDKLSTKLIAKLKEDLVAQVELLEQTDKKSPAYKTITESIERASKLIETIEENKTRYLNRSYQIFVDESYVENITLPEGEVNKIGQQKIDNAVKFLVEEEGYTEEKAKQYVADYLDAIKRNKNDVSFLTDGVVDVSFLKKRKDVPQAFRDLLGESRDPLYNFVNTAYKLSGYLASVEYQKNLRNSLLETGVGITTPKQGYTKLTPNTEGWQTLSDLYVPNEVKQSIDDMMPLEPVNNEFFKSWLKFTAFTKFGKTIASPTTTARNLISGVFLGLNAGHFTLFNPKAAATAFNSAWDTKKSYKQQKVERQKLIRLGVLKDGGRSGELVAVMNDFSKEADRMIKSSKFQWTTDFLKKVYSFGDDFYKVAGFYIERDRLMKTGLTQSEAEQKAADRTNGGYPTYSYVPRTFQHVRRIPLVGTFISFPYEVYRTTKNNIEYIAEDVKEGRFELAARRAVGMVLANGFSIALSGYTRDLIGFDDEDDDSVRDMLPEWQTDSNLIYTGTKNGKPTFIDATALFPSETITKPLRIMFEERKGRTQTDKLKLAAEDVLSPYLSADLSTKTMFEIVTNQDQYGRKIYKGEGFIEGLMNNPENIANYYMKQAGIGAYNNLTEFMRANEVAPDFYGNKYTSYGREYTNRDALLALAGFRISTINYSSGMTSLGYKMQDAMVEARANAYKKVKSTSRYTETTDAELDKVVDEYAKENKIIFKKGVSAVASGRKLGMTDEEIKDALVASGFSKTDANDLLFNIEPKLKIMSKQTMKKFNDKIRTNYKGDQEKIDELVLIFDNKTLDFNTKIKEYNKSIK